MERHIMSVILYANIILQDFICDLDRQADFKVEKIKYLRELYSASITFCLFHTRLKKICVTGEIESSLPLGVSVT